MAVLIFLFLVNADTGYAQKSAETPAQSQNTNSKKVKIGTASYYAHKFLSCPTTTGEKYDHTLFTAACNVFPLNRKVKVTNLRNGRSVIVRINDHLSRTNKRLIDLSRSAAKELGFISRGLTKVKVELLSDNK